MSDIKTALQEFVATYNDPKVARDIDKTLSYFPELKGFDKNALSEYIATYEDPKVKGDWDKVNSYFPEFFADNKTQKTTAPKTTADRTYMPLILAFDFLKPYMKQQNYDLHWYETAVS